MSAMLLIFIFGREEAEPGISESGTEQTAVPGVNDRADILPTQKNIDLFGAASAR